MPRSTRQLQADTLSNQDIHAALLTSTYTVDAERKVYARIFASGLAGNGDYKVYLTVQRLGTGTVYPSQITTDPVPSGTTAQFFTTIGVWVNSADVCKAYLLGLSGDTSGVGLITEWWEDDYARPTVWDKTIDVSATGEVGLDFDNVHDASGAHTLTNITVPTVTTLTNDAGITQAGADKVWSTTARTITAFGFTVAANLTQILGTALTETIGGYLAAGFKKLHDVSMPVFTLASLNQSGDTFAKFSGITLLANWLRGLARKDAMNATAKTELNSGGGTFDEATDSTEALRDRGDAAWVTGGAGLSAQNVRDAMKLAPTAGAPVATSIDDKLNNLTPGAPINLVVEETDIVVNP